MTKQNVGDLEERYRRLQAFAMEKLDDYDAINTEAVAALAEPVDPNGWMRWQETKAQDGQWFLWRGGWRGDGDVGADRVGVDEHGFIFAKYGCGLDDHMECQPLRMGDELAAAVAMAEEKIKRRSR